MGNKASTADKVALGARIAVAGASAVSGVAAATSSMISLATESATLLGLSTAAQSGILGMSIATVGVGAIVIVAMVGIGVVGYWLYTRRRQAQNISEAPVIEQVQVSNPLLADQLNPNYKGPNIPDF